MKLNLGAGGVSVPGFASVDLEPPADYVGDFMEMDFDGVEAVEMSHVLEHVSFHRTNEALARVRSWMVPEGELRVEVPDCASLVAMDPNGDHWQQWMFGSQERPGCAHLAGFTVRTLGAAIRRAGWTVQGIFTFESSHSARRGYPCIEARATA